MDEALLSAAYRYAYALTHAHRDAEDLVHDAWLSAQGRWRRPSKTYLYQAIRHRWIDRIRRSRNDMMVAPTEEVAPPPHDVSGSIARVDLLRAIGTLRPRERELVFLMIVEQWTAREIASHTGLPRGTVLSMVHRAKAKLAGALTEEGESDVHTQPR